jgi:hypothetical protein
VQYTAAQYDFTREKGASRYLASDISRAAIRIIDSGSEVGFQRISSRSNAQFPEFSPSFAVVNGLLKYDPVMHPCLI